MERERVIEIFAGLILIVFLLTLVLVAIGFNEQITNTSTVSQSYNVNSYNTYTSPTTRTSYTNSQPRYLDYSKPYIVDEGSYAKVYSVRNDLRYTDSYDRYSRYHDFGRQRTVRSVLGTNIDNYEVYVRNREYTGGYFKVNFYFEDYSGDVDSYSVTHYISAHDEQKFVFKDVSPRDYKYGNWGYKIVPQTKMPTTVYYN